MKKIYVYGGGTLVHVRPHFSIAAPAYGTAARTIYQNLSKTIRPLGLEYFEVIHVPTKMSDPSSFIETNDQLSKHVFRALNDPNTACIVMSCAICDFKPESISFDEIYDDKIGKDKDRLNSYESFSLNLCPADKIINMVKKQRPDVKLISFKTTSDESFGSLVDKTILSMEKSGSDLVFGNDVAHRFNMIRTAKDNYVSYPNRYVALMELNKRIVEMLNK